MKPDILLEICCGSAEDAIEAARGGADRVELNNNLFQGGLTPSIGTLEVVKAEIDIPVMAMVRPRAGGFCYTETELATARADARALIRNGADGLVFGFLQATWRRESPACFTGRWMWCRTGNTPWTN